MDDDVVAVIGTETTPGAIPPSVPRVYGGFGCTGCGRICGWVDNDGRCQSCGPIPVEKPEPTEADKSLAALQREREIAQRIRRDRLDRH
jgi:hypothetical protein